MKAKYILLAILSLAISTTSEAQILKKIKKKAEQAAERTILKKTDEVVTNKTDKTIDDVANGKEKKEDSTISASNNKNASTKANNNGAFNSKSHDTAELPDHYEFNWELKTEITSGKDQIGEFNYLINDNTTDYSGLEMSSEELKGQGKMYMVMDNLRKTTVMFMDMNGQKMAQVHKIPEVKDGKNKSTMSFKEIGTKEILGFTCYGIEVEDESYVGQMYFTLDAPVNFSAFFAMANNKSTPKGFDPALLQVLKEDALLLEMTMTHKQKSKENYTMRAVSLEKKKMELFKKEYQFMKMGL